MRLYSIIYTTSLHFMRPTNTNGQTGKQRGAQRNTLPRFTNSNERLWVKEFPKKIQFFQIFKKLGNLYSWFHVWDSSLFSFHRFIGSFIEIKIKSSGEVIVTLLPNDNFHQLPTSIAHFYISHSTSTWSPILPSLCSLTTSGAK